MTEILQPVQVQPDPPPSTGWTPNSSTATAGAAGVIATVISGLVSYFFPSKPLPTELAVSLGSLIVIVATYIHPGGRK
jgi:hypothetical protein